MAASSAPRSRSSGRKPVEHARVAGSPVGQQHAPGAGVPPSISREPWPCASSRMTFRRARIGWVAAAHVADVVDAQVDTRRSDGIESSGPIRSPMCETTIRRRAPLRPSAARSAPGRGRPPFVVWVQIEAPVVRCACAAARNTRSSAAAIRCRSVPISPMNPARTSVPSRPSVSSVDEHRREVLDPQLVDAARVDRAPVPARTHARSRHRMPAETRRSRRGIPPEACRSCSPRWWRQPAGPVALRARDRQRLVVEDRVVGLRNISQPSSSTCSWPMVMPSVPGGMGPVTVWTDRWAHLMRRSGRAQGSCRRSRSMTAGSMPAAAAGPGRSAGRSRIPIRPWRGTGTRGRCPARAGRDLEPASTRARMAPSRGTVAHVVRLRTRLDGVELDPRAPPAPARGGTPGRGPCRSGRR